MNTDPKNQRVHRWLYKHFGKPDRCEHCKKPSKNYNWAKVKSVEYDFLRDNFFMLCRSCHTKYDYNGGNKIPWNKDKKMAPEFGKKMSIINTGRKYPNRKHSKPPWNKGKKMNAEFIAKCIERERRKRAQL